MCVSSEVNGKKVSIDGILLEIVWNSHFLRLFGHLLEKISEIMDSYIILNYESYFLWEISFYRLYRQNLLVVFISNLLSNPKSK